MSEDIELVRGLIKRRRVPSELAYHEATTLALEALLRDAERFRKLAAKHAENSESGMWCEVVHSHPQCWAPSEFDPVELPLAEIADALPALTDSNRQNDRHS